jgi:hypothetical protein
MKLHKARRFLQKAGISLIRLSENKEKRITEDEKQAYLIFRKMTKDPENDLLTSPLSGKYYIRSERRKMLLILNNGTISIVNTVYGYNVTISRHIEDKMRHFFLNEVEERRQEMEKEYTENVVHSLRSIVEKLSR